MAHSTLSVEPVAFGVSRARAAVVVGGALAAGSLTHALVGRTHVGAGWLVLDALLVVGTVLAFGRDAAGRVRPSIAGAIAALGALAVGAALVWRESAWTALIAFPASVLLLAASPFLLVRRGGHGSLGDLPRALVEGALAVPSAAVESAKLPLHAIEAIGRPRARSLWRGLLLGAPLTGLFVLLLSADERFAAALVRLAHGSGGAARFAAWSAVGAAGYLFWYVLHDTGRRKQATPSEPPHVPYRTPGDAVPVDGETARGPLVRPLTWGIVLAQLCVVFALFGAANAKVLFAGHALARARSTVTYAQYLHSGFAQLSIATLLAVVTVVVGHILLRPRGGSRVPGGAALATLEAVLLALTSVALLSSFLRVRVYETAYGYTHLRLGVEVLQLGVLVLLAFTVLKSIVRGWRGFGAAVTSAGFVLVVGAAWFDADLYVARGNVDRAEAARTSQADRYAWKELDVAYLTALSPDAAPVLDHPYFALDAATADGLRSAWTDRTRARRREGWRAFRGSGRR